MKLIESNIFVASTTINFEKKFIYIKDWKQRNFKLEVN